MRLIRAVTRPLVLACLGVLSLSAEELPKAEGVDVVRAAKAIAGALSGPESSVAQGKAWEQDIAGLTDARPEIHTQAMAALIRRGAQVVSDLTVLAKDQDPALRMRVAAVLAAIGGEDATSELQRLSHDRDRGVDEVATLSLGKARGTGSFERLTEILQSSDPSLRQAMTDGSLDQPPTTELPMLFPLSGEALAYSMGIAYRAGWMDAAKLKLDNKK